MDHTSLTEHRQRLHQTQARMARLLGCSLIGYKRFESGARPLPNYIANAVHSFLFCQRHGLWELLVQELDDEANSNPCPTKPSPGGISG